jgi:hypothetical protein
MRLSTLFAILAVLVFAGCVPVANEPLYTPGDIVFEKALVGEYLQGPEKTVFLKKGEGKSYLYSQAGQEKASPVRLLKVGDYYFMDEEMPGQGQHFFFKVGVVGQEVRVWVMSVPWLKALVEKDPKAVAFEIKRKVIKEGGNEVVREQFIFTCPTKGMQAFVLRYLDTPEPGSAGTLQGQGGDAGQARRPAEQEAADVRVLVRVPHHREEPGRRPTHRPRQGGGQGGRGPGSVSGEGIDPEAAAVVKQASQALQGMADQVRKGEEARPLIKAFLKEMAGPARKAAAKLRTTTP